MESLTSALTALTSAGLHYRPFTTGKASSLPAGWLQSHTPAETDAETVQQTIQGHCSGIGVAVGPHAIIERDGSFYLPVALEHEGHTEVVEDWTERWNGALNEFAAVEIMAKLKNGWVDRSPSGGVHWYFLVEVATDDPEIIAAQCAQLTTKVVRQEDVDSTPADFSGDPEAKTTVTLAELLMDDRAVIIAPSGGATHPSSEPWTLINGGPDSMPVLDWSELRAISEVLGALTEVRDEDARSTAPIDSKTARVLSLMSRLGTPDATIALLENAGWAVTSRGTDGTVKMDRDGHAEVHVGGRYRRNGDAWAWGTSFPLGQGMHSYADLVTHFEHGGDAQEAAAAAVARGEVKLPMTPLAPVDRPEVLPDRMATTELATVVARQLCSAKLSNGLPFVVSERTPTGEHIQFISVTAGRELVRWSGSEERTMAISVVQPIRVQKLASKALHELPGSVVDMALTMARESAPSAQFVASGPVLLPSGRTLIEEGFHARDSALVTIPARERAVWADYSVPSTVLQSDAQAALDLLRTELLSDFPFEAAADEARALAYLLTCVSRDLYATAPGFLFTAPDRGSGKDLLASLGRIIATGNDSYQAVGEGDSRETEKKLVTAMLAGQRFIHNPEIRRESGWEDNAIQSLITAPSQDVRQLGGNTQVAVNGRIVTGCGNNASIGSDLVRRFMPIRLHYKGKGVAFGRTQFRHADLPGWTRAHRGELMAACHTILAYGLQQGTDFTTRGFGGFEAWMRVVLGALSHVTIDGENAAELVSSDRDEWVEDSDEEGAEWAELMQAWYTMTTDWMGVGFVRDALAQMRMPDGERPGLPAALVNITGLRDRSSDIQWGRVLQSRRNTRVLVDGRAYWVEVQKWKGTSAKYRVMADEEAAPANVVKMPERTAVEEAVAAHVDAENRF